MIRLLLALCLLLAPSNSFARVRGLVAAAPVVPFTGLIATRGKVDGGHSSPSIHFMTTKCYYVYGNSPTYQPTFKNSYMSNTNVETGVGGASTIHASVEYPPGTCTPHTFSGNPSGTIPDNGTLQPDPLTISIPDGAKVCDREFITNSFGITFEADNGVNQINTAFGDATVTSGATDQTVSCTPVVDSGTAGAHGPLMVTGTTTKKSVCILGDSIAYGSHDTYSGSSGDLGSIERSIGPSFAYSNISSGGDAATTFVGGSRTIRSLIFPYCTSAIVEYGRNDLYPSINHTAAQLEANLTTIYGYFTNPVNAGIFQTTLTPDTASTDSWATTGNQTPVAGGPETNRATFNAALRGSTFGPTNGFFDINNAVGTGSNESLWIVTGAANYCTSDGVHPSPACYALIQSSGAINPGSIK
jgi:hypothetical protein